MDLLNERTLMLPTEGGGTSTGTPAETVLSRPSAYALLTALSTADPLGFGTDIHLALLTGPPALNVAAGTYDISAVELTTVLAPGYARIPIPRATAFGAPAGAAPAVMATNAQVLSPTAIADWTGFNAVALVDNSGACVAWKSLVSVVYVTTGLSARIPVGGFTFYTPSA